MNFDKDYFENGPATNKSCYDNYRWLPEVTIPFAQTIIDYLEIQKYQKILDYGCAKGFLVKAFRELGYNAYGLDISKYAIENSPFEIRSFLEYWEFDLYSLQRFLNKYQFEWVISKDVFEHIDQHKLKFILEKMRGYIKNMFVIVPLGDENGYYAMDNNMDPSHVICENQHWWFNTFTNLGYEIQTFQSTVPGMKQTYEHIENAHGFFTLKT